MICGEIFVDGKGKMDKQREKRKNFKKSLDKPDVQMYNKSR